VWVHLAKVFPLPFPVQRVEHLLLSFQETTY
jgi:hypothetical protein